MPPSNQPTNAGQSLLGTLLGAFIILIVSATLGLITNHFSPRGIPLFPKVKTQKEPAALPLPSGMISINLEAAHIAFQEGSALFLDARPVGEYAEEHVPGAISLYHDEFETRFPELAPQIESAPKLIVYCSGIECSDAIELGLRLQEAISKPIYIFELGWHAWEETGYPSRKGPNP